MALSRPTARRPTPLSGPPVVLPTWLDGLAERWWAASPRARTAVALLAMIVVLAAAIGHAAATPYGPPTTVLVATRDLLPGDVLTDADLRRRTVPRDLVPDGALRRADGVLAAALPSGAVATDRHLGDGGVVASLPAGRVAVAVAADRLPMLTAGMRADLVGADHDGRAATLGRDAIVLAVEAETVWFAVDAGDAVPVTGAAAIGSLAVVVLPP